MNAEQALYGAFFVKEFQQPIFLPSSVSLFDPKAPVPSSPTRHSGKPSRAGAVKAGCLFGDHPRGLALTVPSTAAPSNAVGLGQQDDDQRGARVRARIYRATTLYSVGPRTRTMMQSCASAAKLRSGGPILPFGIEAKETVGNPPPRTVIGTPSQADGQGRNCWVSFSDLRS